MASFQEKIMASVLARIRSRRQPKHSGAGLSLEPTAGLPQPRCEKPHLPTSTRWQNSKNAPAWQRIPSKTGTAYGGAIRLWPQGETSHPMGWVLEANGGVVGYMGSIPLQCRYGDRTLNAVSSHAFIVDPPYRACCQSGGGILSTEIRRPFPFHVVDRGVRQNCSCLSLFDSASAGL